MRTGAEGYDVDGVSVLIPSTLGGTRAVTSC